MSVRTKFEKRFYEDIIDMLVLTKACTGASGEKNMLKPSVEFIASVNLTTGEFSSEKGILEWLIKDSPDRSGWGFDFKLFEIYHIKARKGIPNDDGFLPDSLSYLNNCYMVVDLVEEFVSEPRLDKIREKVLKPVVIEKEGFGTFVLDRQISLFCGTIEWMGKECTVFLEPDDENEDTAKKAFLFFQEFYQDIENRDRQCRTYAAEELTELANEWLEDREDDNRKEEPISKKEFAGRMQLKELSISPDGDLTLFYNDDDMFWGHSVIVEADIHGEILSADIIG